MEDRCHELWSSPSECDRGSLHLDCLAEEDAHKWRESEKACRDLGDNARYQWAREHWSAYLRARWIEHIEGRKYWIEFGRGTFGLMKHPIPDSQELYQPIYNKLKAGHENLDIICWAKSNGAPLELVNRFLEALDLNRCHLKHRLDEHPR